MLHSLIGWSVRFRLLVAGLAIATIAIGVLQVRAMPVDVLPEFAPPYVEVQTEALGLSAEEVEQLVTVPLEADLLNGVAWLDEIRSESIAGLSSIVMTFEPGTDVIRARQMVAERLTQAHALPNVSKPPAMLQPLSTENRLMIVSLQSDTLPLIDQSVLARWTIRPRLMGIPGVANVAIWGQRERQLQVLVDPRELQAKGVSLENVIRTTGNSLWVSPLTFLEASTPGTGGFIETNNQRLGIQHILPIKSPGDLARVVVEREEPAEVVGEPLRLGDVAAVVEDHQPLIGDAVVGDGGGLLLVIEKFPGVNTVDVTREVEDTLRSMQPGLAGIQIDTNVFRPANFIESATGNVAIALLVGFLLAAVVIGALRFDWRAFVVAAVTLPVSLVSALFVLQLAGATLNALVVAGLVAALGVVIDDVVRTVDHLLERLRQAQPGDAQRSRVARLIDGAATGRTPLVYATVVVALALVPLAVVGGPLGRLLPAMLAAYGLAVLASFVAALTVTPALITLLLAITPRTPASRRSPILARLRPWYRESLGRVLDNRRTPLASGAAIVAGVLVVAGVALAPRGEGLVLPSFQAREILVHWDGGPGTSRSAMVRIADRASAELRSVAGVESVGAHVGRAILSDEVGDVNRADLWITIAPSADYDVTLDAIHATVAGYPGLESAVVTYPEDRVRTILATTEGDARVRVYGQDLGMLDASANSVRDAAASVPGVTAATVEALEQQPSLQVEVDLAAAERHGVKAGDVRRTATTLLSGIEAGLLFQEQKVFEVVVWGKPELRRDVSSIGELQIEKPDGTLVPLAEIADVRFAPAVTAIRREGVMRYVDVVLEVQGRDLAAVLTDVRGAVSGVQFPQEYHASVMSDRLVAEQDTRFLAVVALVVALLAFLVVQAAVGSWLLAALVAVSLPASLAGGALAAGAVGSLFAVGTLAGAMLVAAIAVRSSLSLVDHVNRLRGEDGDEPVSGVLVRAADDRLAPTLTSAVATIAALVPFVVLGNVAGLEIVRPMAIFTVGGLVTTALVNLFVMPSLCVRAGQTPHAREERRTIEQLALEPATE